MLRRRGSPLAKARDRAQRLAQETASPQAPPYDPPSDAQLRAWSRLIPNYDPWRGAAAYRFDCKKARKVITFFETQLRHVKGEFAGRLFILEPWQKGILANLFGWVSKATGLRRYRECFTELPRKNGKLFDLQCPLCTPTGWTTIGELKVGDALFDENGNICRVLQLHPVDSQGGKYRVSFSNGEQVIASGEHLWLTTARVNMPGAKTGRAFGENTRLRTTEEIRDTLRYGTRNDLNHSMDMPGALQLPDVALPLHPYVLGVWLGNGTSVGAQVTLNMGDADEVISRIEGFGTQCTPKKQERYKHCARLTLSKTSDGASTVSLLRAVKLLGNKHIPAAYLRASVEQRLLLLQGLMDTDGYIEKRGFAAEYTTCTPALADGVCELLASLGIKYSCRAMPATLYGRIVNAKWRIQFAPTQPAGPVSLLARRATRAQTAQMSPRSRTVQITGVEPCEPIPGRCITVDSPTGMFRFGRTMLSTHNSTLAAGLILYLLFEDEEPGAEIYGAASKYEQASLVWTHAAGMMRQNSDMMSRGHIFKGQAKAIEAGAPGDPTYATYRVISSDSLGSHGYNIHGVIIDELHAFQSGDLVDTLVTGTGSRRQPMIIYITTRDFDRVSVCNEKEAYAKGVRDGLIDDPHLLPVLYMTDDENTDWKQPSMWRKVNPNIGVSVSETFLRDECRKAIETPRFENVFKRLYLCMKTQQETRWLPIDTWKACIAPVTEDSLSGRNCIVGMDLSSNRDVTAVCYLFPPSAGHDYYEVKWSLYVPAANVEQRVRRDKVPYDVWAQQGHLTLTPGNAVDYKRIRKDVFDAAEVYNITRVAFDRWGFEALRQQFVDEGMDEGLFVSFGQGFASMSPAMKALERLLLAQQLAFADNPVVLWMANNVAVQTDPAGNIKPTKEGSGERIDGIVALTMAVGAASVEPQEDMISEHAVLIL